MDRPLRLFVEFSPAEAEVLKRLQEDMSAHGEKLTLGEIIRGCVSLYVKDTLGEEYFTAPAIKLLQDLGDC